MKGKAVTEENETKKSDAKLEEPAKVGYEAFVGVDTEYRDPNRNPMLTQADVDAMTAEGRRTDAQRHRDNQTNVVLDFNESQGYFLDEDGNVVGREERELSDDEKAALAADEDKDSEESGQKSDKSDATFESPLL